MKAKRISDLCIHLGIELSEREVLRALSLSNRAGEKYIRRIADRPNAKKISCDLYSTPVHFWPDDAIVATCNDRGNSKRALIHARAESLRIFGLVSKLNFRIKELEDIIKYIQDLDETSYEVVREAKKLAAARHHPDSRWGHN